MSRPNTIALAIAVAALTASCAKDAPPTENTRIHGTVAQELRQPGMQALAIGADGRWISTSVAADGGFTLDLPGGQSYRVVLATKTPSGAERVVARVVLDGTSGRTVWVSTTSRDIAFGTLHQVGAATAASNPSSVSTQSETVETGDSENEKEGPDDDADSTEHDKDSYEGCSAADAKDVEPSNDDADEHADSAEHEDDHEGACKDDGEKDDD